MRTDLFAFVVHFSLIRDIGAVDDLHQSGFARAVLAADDVNLARPYLKIDSVQRLYAGKHLNDVFHLQDKLCVTHRLVTSFFPVVYCSIFIELKTKHPDPDVLFCNKIG